MLQKQILNFQLQIVEKIQFTLKIENAIANNVKLTYIR